MSSTPLIPEHLNSAIDWLIADPSSDAGDGSAEMRELLNIAKDLRRLPRPEFKAQLQADLMERAYGTAMLDRPGFELGDQMVSAKCEEPSEAVLPTLFGLPNTIPVQRSTFVASFVAHVAVIALLATSGYWMVQQNQQVHERVVSVITEPSLYPLPVAPDKSGGGGGGGDHDKLAESKGALPRFAREQIAPPVVVLRNESPKLSAEPTVVGPPQLSLPSSAIGNPLATVASSISNGTGSGGGIGSGIGTGIGSGHGPGVGPGYGGGIGGGVYRVGGGVSAPRPIYDPEPDYSEEARKAKHQGTVILFALIGTDGRVSGLKVVRSLGMGLDEKALEGVRKWRFEPAKKDGHAVAVEVNIEVAFRLY